MFKNKKVLILLSIIAIGVFGGLFLFKNNKDVYINTILSTSSYSYLPNEAKEYIKEVYEKTGEIILTEKNKEENKLYLNPQYVDYITLSDEEKNGMGDIPMSMIVDYSNSVKKRSILPSNYDLRYDNENNYVTPVRDQGQLGICWAFASAGIAESYLLKKDNVSYSPIATLFAERQIDYATGKYGIVNYESEYISFIDRKLGGGGNFYISTVAMANGISLVNYNNFKSYDDTDLMGMKIYDVLNYNDSMYELNSTMNFPYMNLRESTNVLSEDEKQTRINYLNEVKQNIMTNGAAYVGTRMGISRSCTYEDENLNNMVIDVYNCHPANGGHAMEIIGWDDNIEYSYCADTNTHNANIANCSHVITGKGVWILKNSWGDTFPNPYLTYDSLYTSISFIESMSSNEEKTWDNNYILGDEGENTKEKVYSLSNTKIRGNEKLKKIKFITQIPDEQYTISISKTDDTYETITKNIHMPGLITLDIDSDITVNSNTQIIISTNGAYIDKLMVFTSNIDVEPYIDLTKYNNKTYSDLKNIIYSDTKNIPSDSIIEYKLYNSNNEDISDYLTYSDNVVAENNVNTVINLSSAIANGTYRIDALYQSEIVGTTTFNYAKMQGEGTEDNPYIITTPAHLSQIRNDLDAYYVLGNDIDLTEDTSEGGALSKFSDWCPQGFGWEAINNFSGTLDGQGHTIKGLHQNNFLICGYEDWPTYNWNKSGNGLFGRIIDNVTIKNLILDGFDMNCFNGSCGVLASSYIAGWNAETFTQNSDDTTEYNAVFENIAVKNSKIRGKEYHINGGIGYGSGGGLFGNLTSTKYGNISISNIYLDIDMQNDEGITNLSYLTSDIYGKNIDIANIRIVGNLNGKYDSYDSSKHDSVLINKLFADSSTTKNINNILSTMTATNVYTNLIGKIWQNTLDDKIEMNNINLLKIVDSGLSPDSNAEILNNVNIYDKENQLIELTKRENYQSWDDFDDNWIIETIDGLPRIPVLKFMDFEYTNIPNININQKLNEKYNIYDYITPNINAAKNISYHSNDENIFVIDDNGYIIPKSSGNATIHIESYYDGYINDVPISINYVPHYTIVFDANGGEGQMESLEAKINQNAILTENTFTKNLYEFKEWNTKADGSGNSYSDLAEITAMSDGETLTLYAQWIGEELVVNFDPNGGTVNPNKKIVRRFETYGELPLPQKVGYAFNYWLHGNTIVMANDIVNGTNLKAIWTSNAYNIVYDGNGGELIDDFDDYNYMILSESKIITYASNGVNKNIGNCMFERTNYTFTEWNTSADGSGDSYTPQQVINMGNVSNDRLTLYAIWNKSGGTITFHANDGTNNTVIQNVTFNTEVILQQNTFVREGYVFAGWTTEADGTGEGYTDKDVITLTNNIDLYAQWVINNGTITFHANDGTNNTAIQNVTFNTEVILQQNTFVREGYVFVGWTTEADGTGEGYTDKDVITLTSSIDLYAQWVINSGTITFHANDGTNNTVTQNVAFNTEVILQQNTFVREGYVFAGWTTEADGSGEGYTDKDVITLTNNIDLYAQWTESFDYVINKYSVDKTNKYISKIMAGTTVNNFKKNVELGEGYSVEVDSKDNLLYTGGKTKINKNGTLYIEYTNIVIGDINGDGAINSADLLKIRQHLLSINILSGPYFIASDINYDNSINSADLLRVRQHLLGTKPIE